MVDVLLLVEDSDRTVVGVGSVLLVVVGTAFVVVAVVVMVVGTEVDEVVGEVGVVDGVGVVVVSTTIEIRAKDWSAGASKATSL